MENDPDKQRHGEILPLLFLCKEQASFPEHRVQFYERPRPPTCSPRVIFFLTVFSRELLPKLDQSWSNPFISPSPSPLPKSHFRRIRAVRNDPIINTNRVYRSTPVPHNGTMIVGHDGAACSILFYTRQLYERIIQTPTGKERSLSLSIYLSIYLYFSFSAPLRRYLFSCLRRWRKPSRSRGCTRRSDEVEKHFGDYASRIRIQI